MTVLLGLRKPNLFHYIKLIVSLVYQKILLVSKMYFDYILTIFFRSILIFNDKHQ
jgi:hypothetical protein